MNGFTSDINFPHTYFSECSNLCYDYNADCFCNDNDKKDTKTKKTKDNCSTRDKGEKNE